MQELKNRPILHNSITEGNIGMVELFQNEVVRPVIKMQHEILMMLFYDAIPMKVEGFNQLPMDDKSKIVEVLFSKDQKWKTLLIGMIIGQFSPAEIAVFISNRKEFSKRMVQICKERVLSVVLK